MYAEKALKNTIYNTTSLIINSLLNFVVRTVFIRYFGEEVLGVNATIVDTVNLLTMSEMGIQTAIIYKMYKPINDKDYDRQCELFNLYKNAYRVVAVVILVGGLILLPVIPSIVKTRLENGIVYKAYLVQLLLVVLTYLLSYYKIVLLANQRQFVYTKFEAIVNVVCSAVKYITIVYGKNYFLYLGVGYLALIMNTSFIVFRTKKDYPLVLRRCQVPKDDLKTMALDLKKMVIITVSGYVYGSTDSILISTFFGSIWVGLISNYKMITNIVKSLIVSYIASAVAPSWGTFLQSNPSKKRIWDNYSMFVFIEFLLGMTVLLPMWLLADDFITLWIGNSFVINNQILFLIVIDIFITSLNEPAAVIMRNLGLFSEENVASIWAMIANIVLSIVLASQVGIIGIFIGTIVAVFIYSLTRLWYVNKRCFSGNIVFLLRIHKDIFVYVCTFMGLYGVLSQLFKRIFLDPLIWTFVLKGIIIEAAVAIVIVALWWKSGKLSKVIRIVKR